MIKFYAFLKKKLGPSELYCYEFLAASEKEATNKAHEECKRNGKNWKLYGGPFLLNNQHGNSKICRIQ